METKGAVHGDFSSRDAAAADLKSMVTETDQGCAKFKKEVLADFKTIKRTHGPDSVSSVKVGRNSLVNAGARQLLAS
eukprot:5099013-Pyramimonas_sp.AAC.1